MQTLKDKSCLVPCSGLYADIADDSLQQTTQAAFEHNLMKGETLVLTVFIHRYQVSAR